MPLLRLTKVRAQRAHRRNFLDHVRKQILSGWGLLFFKRKGSLCMNEEVVVDDYVKAFAEHIQCDPELAQELYFKHKVTEALDGLVPLTFRSPNSFMRPFAQMPRGFCRLAMSGGGADCRPH